jgi:ceramide glucosyltransferase
MDLHYKSPMDLLILTAGIFVAGASIVQVASIITVIRRLGADAEPGVVDMPAVSILRPVCGIENFIEQTLLSAFHLDYPRYEIIFCVEDGNDPVIPVVEMLMAAHPEIEARLLVGRAVAGCNPKLNNLVKGWHAARHDWILMADSNVLMPPNQLQCMLSAWRSDTGLVCSPPIGGAPGTLWAELECAFLNTYQARWQCFADSMGLGFAQGKSMLWRRELLDRSGGIEALGHEVAEDAAATKIVRAAGLRVRLVAEPFMQPLGYRSAAEVWRRQVRWARLRRRTFKWFFAPEILVGGVPPLAAATAMAAALGWPILATVGPLAVVWYSAEVLLATLAGWPMSLRSVAMCLLRDALLPVLWVAAWLGDEFEWRGNAMTVAEATRSP